MPAEEISMLRLFVTLLLIPATFAIAAESEPLEAPEGWGGETIRLPPPFAADMKLKGEEHIRFAPGMMKPESDTFFSYAFVFDLEKKTALTEASVKDEFLKYYRGLCSAVMNEGITDAELAKFDIVLRRVAPDTKPSLDEMTKYTGTLDWVEPFATKKPQKLNLEIWTWTAGDRNYLFACVSPQAKEAAIWKQLDAIRSDYLK